MLEAVPLLVVTLSFITIFLSSVASAELGDIRANWNTRRCEPVVMAMAQMVPEDESVNRSDFASENFQFCIGRVIDSTLSVFFTPVMKIFDKQLSNAGQVQDVVKNMNSSAASLISPFTEIFSTLFKKLEGILYQVIRIFFKMSSAFDRMFGIAVASVFAGASMMKAIQNTINYVIRVILIILTVLVVLTIFLWFVLFPYVPIIVTTIGILATTVAGAAASGMAGAFCVIPGTLVEMANGEWKPVEQVQPGDILQSGAKVEGVLQTTGDHASLVNVKGVVVSESHLVFDELQNKWCCASKHTSASPSNVKTSRLYCLNTNDRCWNVRGDLASPVLQLRDWEELPPETDIYNSYWEAYVYEILNRQAIANTCGISVPGRGLLGYETLVYEESKGLIPIHEIKIGDAVKDKDTFTKVLAVYRDTSSLVPSSGPNGSVWMFHEGKRVWKHPDAYALLQTAQKFSNQGYHLITESGCFFANNLRVRDFTEIGYNRIDDSYSRVLSAINENNFDESS